MKYMPDEEGLYVQYGCAWCAPKSWRNFDASPTLRFERIPFIGKLYTLNASRFPENVEYGDIIKGLPIPPNFCSGIYCSHVLEHLALDDFRVALKNTHRLLRRGGLFRTVVPDLETLVRAYIKSGEPLAAEQFMRATNLGVVTRTKTLFRFLIAWLGNTSHLWMWDYKSLEYELAHAGFTDIRRCAFGDSTDPMMIHVEDEDRYIDAVAVECKKP